MSEAQVTPPARGYPPQPPMHKRSADWGGKALIVFALALLMAIPGLFVFALVAERAHRAEEAAEQISSQLGGRQQVLGPMLIAPYSLPDAKGQRVHSGWYAVSAETGSVKLNMRTEPRHLGIFEVPTYNTEVEIDAVFVPPATLNNLAPEAVVDWSQARIIMGATDLRAVKTNLVGVLTAADGTKTTLNFAPSGGFELAGREDGPQSPSPFGFVAATGAAPAMAAGGARFHSTFRLTGAEKLSVLPFARSTHVESLGNWPDPSFIGGFLPEHSEVTANGFKAEWNTPFIARGLSSSGPTNILSVNQMAAKDAAITLLPANDPYQNVMRALKYAVMFVGLVFLTFFVFEALSGKRLHPAQYILVGLAQMIFYMLLLSLSERIGFDIAFGVAATATVGLIGMYAGWAFKGLCYQIQALVIFSAVYGLIYLLMRLEDLALLAGSLAAFVGLASAMWLTRNIEWYGGQAAEAPKAS